MTDILLHTYLPLFAWTGMGIALFRVLPASFPRFLGRSLYWIGVPLEILALTRRSSFSFQASVVPLVTIATLLGGLGLVWLTLYLLSNIQVSNIQGTQPLFFPASPIAPGSFSADSSSDSSYSESSLPQSSQSSFPAPSIKGSFLLSAILANTGFVGLAIVPSFVSAPYLSWVVLYSVTHNIVGSYGMGVWVASSFGRSSSSVRGWRQLRDVFTVPSLWAFGLGSATQSIALPVALEQGLQASVSVIIPIALLLMGIRISQLQGWKSLKTALIPACFKAVLLPGLVALATTIAGISGDARLVLVLMSGMPTAFAGLILAEEYDLDRELIASSIVLTTGSLVLTIPLWLWLL
jgi:predicted permease